ncbi:hypothetical protein HA402_005541 [Bradysia odoriphaga]|nr:hypothetical protein HA402_005541 [Bradysia odoriphaga]
MGIDKLRFTETIIVSIAEFLCGICDNVVADPILTKECEHCLCRSCVTVAVKICPTCSIKVNGFEELGTALRRVYSNIKLRCVYKSCKEALTIATYQEHERKCPEGFYECPNLCGFKLRLSIDEAQRAHNCIEILKTKIVGLEVTMVDLKTTNGELNIQIEKLKAENAGLLSALGSQKKRRVTCGAVLAKGEMFYRCYTCQIRRMSVLCMDCFNRGQHENHRVAGMVAEASTWYCDCGDTLTLQESATCSKHHI